MTVTYLTYDLYMKLPGVRNTVMLCMRVSILTLTSHVLTYDLCMKLPGVVSNTVVVDLDLHHLPCVDLLLAVAG